MKNTLKNNLIKAVEDLRKSPPAFVTNGGTCYPWVLRDLKRIEEFNKRGESYCGMASDMMLEYVPDVFKKEKITADVITATASANNGCFHHYNLIIPRNDAEPLICDLTAAQFFTKPMALFKAAPYFIGTRGKLKMLVEEAQNNTWEMIQNKFPQENFRDLWDVDLKYYQNKHFADALLKSIKEHDKPCLWTESYFKPWDITWGQTARKIHPRTHLQESFTKAAKVISGTTADIKGLINWRTPKTITRAQHP